MTLSGQHAAEAPPQSDATQCAPEPFAGGVPLAAVVVGTEELHRRAQREPNFEAENRALVALAGVLGDAPRAVLQALAETAVQSLSAGSAAVSLLSQDERQLVWPAIAGQWQRHVGGGAPHRLPVAPPAEECLRVPIHVGGKAVGTLWAIAHDRQGQFDAEDLRQLQSLSRFAAAACQSVAALDAAAEQAEFARSLKHDAARVGLEMAKLDAEQRQSEQRFRTVFDSIDEGFCILEKVQDEAGQALDFRVLEANPAFAAQCGKRDVVGQTIRQAFPGQSEDWLLSYAAVLQTGEPARFERGLVADGRLLQVHAFSIKGAAQGRVAVIFKDVAERPVAEQGVRENEAFNRSIIASSPDCIKVLDLNGNLLSMYSGNELLGIEDIRPFLNKSWIEFWSGEDRRQALAALASAAAGQTGKFVGFFRTLRGEPKWWDVAISPIVDEQHRPVRLLAVSRDVTQRKTIEDSLLLRTFQFETLVNNAPLGIYLVDADFRIRQVNPIALQEFDSTRGLIGQDFGVAMRAMWEPTRADEIIGRFRHTLATGEACVVPEHIGHRIDRQKVEYFEWQINRIPLPDGRHGVVCYFRDISERHLAQELTRENEWRLSYATQAARLTYVEIDLASAKAKTPANFDAVMGFALRPDLAIDGAAGARTLLEHVVPDDRPAVQAALQDFFAGKALGRLEYRVLGDDRALRWIETRWSVLLGLDGKPFKSFATNIDITDRKQAEQAMRAGEERYRNLFNSMDEGYCILELIFDEHDKPVDWLFLEVNPAFSVLTGIANAVGMRMLELSPFHEAHWFETYGKVALTGQAIRFVSEAKSLDGRWFDLYAFKVGGPGSRTVAVLFNNITARVQAERALRDSEERYRTLFGSIDEGFCIIEMMFDEHDQPIDFCFLEVNPTFEKHTGLHSPVGKRLLDLVPGIEAHWIDTFGQVALTGQTVRFVSEAKSIEGRWFDVYACKLGGPGSRQVAIVLNDISERRKSETALRQSEEQFRATFETAAIGIFHLGLDHRWLRVNPAMCRLTGYAAEALTAMAFTDLTHPEDLPHNLNQLQRLLAGEIASYTIEKRFIHMSGRAVWVTATASLLRDAEGLPLYFIGAVEDITEKKATLAQLELQRRFVERLTHGMPNTLHVYSRAERRNLWVNRHLGDTLGYSAQDITLMGQSFLQQVLHPDDVTAMDQHFDRVFASADSDVLDIEYRVRDHAGQWRWLRQCDTVFGRDLRGQVLEFVGTATDVTARKGTEADLIAALSAAEDANRAKSDFLSRMSHELRSPLNAVLGFAQLLQRGLPPLTPLQQESASEILKAGWYLLGLIDEILDLSLIESGRLSFVLEPVRLLEVLDDCHALVEGQAAQRGIALSFVHVPENCHVSADRTRIKQVFVNLLGNAIKYNRPGGTVDVHCTVTAQGAVRISVRDSGSGLSTAQMAQLFQPFERLGQETGVIEGTGIGLALSKQLVELMGGHIGVHSTPGQGSEFWVELETVASVPDSAEPARQALGAQDTRAGRVGEGPLPAHAERQFTVLCVEDNAANLVLMRRLLALRGDVRLLLARDGDEGLQMARQLRPDVVLMDINLPGISGLDAMTQLSADKATAHIPVIAISAQAMRHDIEKGLQAGFFRYLTKPFKIDAFTEALDAALDVAHARSPAHKTEALTP